MYGAKPPLGVATNVWELPAQFVTLAGVTVQDNGAKIVTDPSTLLRVSGSSVLASITSASLLRVNAEVPVGPSERKVNFATEISPTGVERLAVCCARKLTCPRMLVMTVKVDGLVNSLVSPPV